MRRLWSWLKSWWGIGRVSRQLSAIEERLEDLMGETKDLLLLRNAHYLSWVGLREKMEEASNQAKEDLDKADALIVRYEEELEAARAKITIHEESIDTLVSANKTFKEAWDAISAEQIRRRVASNSSPEELG